MPTELFNEELGRKAFDAMEPRWKAPDAPSVRLNVDLQAMAGSVLDSVKALRQETDGGATLEVRLLEFPRWALDPAHLLELETKAWACWYIHARRANLAASSKGAKVSKADLSDAKERRARMLRLLDHHLNSVEAVQKELAHIRKGNGYEDLALDLERLAALYDLHAPKLSTDPTWWKADDAPEARRLAIALTERARGDQASEWNVWAGRGLASLRASYSRVRDAVRFAWPDRPDIQARFPAL
jgi:hypothetical protein